MLFLDSDPFGFESHHKWINEKRTPKWCPFFIGGPEEIRTLGLRVANAALYQLSYEPI